MDNSPAISVVVPMYKVEQYIKICVDSILAQTFQDFEIILVDDASPDRCAELCQKFYGGNDKVRLVRHEKNLGLGPARNTGIKHSRGKYVYFVDSDDLILPNALEKFFTVAEKNNAQVVHANGWYDLFQDEPEPIRQENLKIHREKYSQEGFLKFDPVYRLKKHWVPYTTWSVAWLCFCRRDFLTNAHIEFLPIISEDETFAVALYCLTERYYIMPEVVYVWRRRSGSIMTTRNVERFSQNVRSIILGLQYTKNFLDAVPRFEGYEAWCRSVFYAFVLRFVNNHTYPYLKGTNVASEINAAAEKLFTEIFGDNAYFVKYFFLHYHTNRRQAENLTKQVEQFKAQQQNIVATFIREHPGFLELMASVRADGKRVLLMHTPHHGNIGDQAIVLGEVRVLEKFFPEHKIIEVPTDYFRGDNGKLLWALGFETYVRRDDIIFLHGGGNLGNLWLGEEKIRRALIERFPQNKIVSFPQSIHFTDDDSGRAELATSQKIYGAHPDLHLMMRDENSFDFATKNFPSAKNYLLPDSVTVLHGITDDCTDERNGVLFVLRGDKEKIRDDKNISRLQKYLADKNIPFTVTDTVIGGRVTSDIREQKVREVLMKFRRSKLVVTDRFHGVIFSFVTRTPVMAFKSFDTKISSGIKWFRNIPSIFYAEGQDWSHMEKFIDTYYFAAEISAALNCKVETDGMERFVRALNQIVGTSEVAPVVQNTPLRLPKRVDDDEPRRLTVDAVEISERRIVFKYTVQGDWEKYFNVGTEFFIEYSEDISRTPKDIAVIPFLCNVLPIAWVLDAEIVVETLDCDFYEHIAQIKQGYVDMYPRVKFGGKLTVGTLVSHDYEVGDETAVFFSGGADSFDTLIAHAEEHPTLVTLLGSDVKLTDAKGWELVSKHALDTAKQFRCKNLFVTSAFRLFLKEGALSKIVMPLANDGWWHGFQHGIGIISHVAPYAYLHRLKRIYIASTHTAEYKATCASDPTIDNHVHIGKCVTIHDGFDFTRQDKIRRICDYSRRTGEKISLRVCWKSSGGRNCCACEKCYRTICGILAEGENPAEFGFPSYTPDTLEQMRRDFQKPQFVYNVVANFWRNIQDRFRERPENLPAGLSWLMEMKF